VRFFWRRTRSLMTAPACSGAFLCMARLMGWNRRTIQEYFLAWLRKSSLDGERRAPGVAPQAAVPTPGSRRMTLAGQLRARGRTARRGKLLGQKVYTWPAPAGLFHFSRLAATAASGRLAWMVGKASLLRDLVAHPNSPSANN
jgi:hypothetical protein